ncbi:MAG: hypothetical protein JNM90_07650 [Burkholderiales bacterium]|nr:hypothetical protein [Burkholderiales bacterium]
MRTVLHCFDMGGAGDVGALAAWLSTQPLDDLRRLVIFAKTEGHHAPNDFSRELLKTKLGLLFGELGLGDTRAMSMLAIGSEGVGSPQGFAFARFGEAGATAADPRAPARLALGFARSEVVPIAEIGTTALVDRTAQTAQAAMRDAGLAPDQVGLLFIKTPTLAARHPEATPERVAMHRGRAVSALGGGVALGEVERARVSDAAIAVDLSLYSRRVQAVTGAEITRVEVVAMGNRPGAAGDLVIDTTHTVDLLDQASIRRLLARHGVRCDTDGALLDGDRVAGLIVKTMVPESGMLRGARTTVYTSAWAPESHMRAAASGVLGSLLGHLRFFVSADAVHQAPEGGGVASAILRVAGGH